MLKPIIKQKHGIVYLRGPITGMILFSLLTFLAAKLVEQGSLPMEAGRYVIVIVLLLSSLFAGAFSGGTGIRGLRTGCVLAFLYLVGKLIFHSEIFFQTKTLIGILCIVPVSWLGSCIFHKKPHSYTNRNRKNRKGNYK